MSDIRAMNIWKAEDRREQVSRDYLNRDVADLDLSVRSYNCLRRAGCETVRDVMALVEDENQGLRKVRNLGTRSEREILEKLGELRAMQASLPEPMEPVRTQRLVKPAKKVWDRSVDSFPVSKAAVKELQECGIQTIGDLYEHRLKMEPGWYAVRELFDCIAW